MDIKTKEQLDEIIAVVNPLTFEDYIAAIAACAPSITVVDAFMYWCEYDKEWLKK